MRRNLKATVKKFSTPPPSTTTTSRHSEYVGNVNYFNLNFTSNSEDISCQAVGPSTQHTNINPVSSPELVVKYFQQFEESPNSRQSKFPDFILLSPEDDDMSDGSGENTEKSLAEIGFKSTEIAEWDKIPQPQKSDLMDLLYNMITRYKKTNVQILIGKTTFNCHMLVLQCYSDFFMELNNEQVVMLPEEKVSPEAFVMVYDWMLAKEPKVHRDGILELFNAATFLSIKGLIDQCWVCLDDDERFCEDAAFLLYLEARKYDHILIQQLMLTRICKFFLTLVASKEFLELSLQEICTLLESNSIGVYSESEVLMSAVRWLHFNFHDRYVHLAQVMKCVRFGLMAPWQLVELRRNKTSTEIQRIVENPAVQSMIDDGLSYVTTKYYYGNREKDFLECLERLHLTEPVERQWIRDKSWSHHDHCPNKHVATYQTFLEYLEYVRGMGKNHWKTLEFNEEGPFWEYNSDKTKYDEARTLASITNVSPNEAMDLIGNQPLPTIILKLKETLENNSKNGQIGTDGDDAGDCNNKNIVKFTKTTVLHFKNNSLDDIEKGIELNDVLHEWQLTNLYNKNIIIFGGIDPRSSQTSDGQGKNVLVFNTQQNKWDHLSTMPGSRHHHSAVTCQGRIYVIGGTRPAFYRQPPINLNLLKEKNITQTVWSFEPQNLQWHNEKSLPFPRRDFGLIAIDKGFYVIGGEEDTEKFPVATTYFYDINTKYWHKKASLNISRSGLMVTLVSNNRFWAAGGIVEKDGELILTDSIEEYNIDLDEWTEVGKLNIPRCYAKLCCVNRSGLYLIGGVGYENKGRKLKSLSSIDKFVSDKKNWIKIGDMSVARHGHDVISVHDKIIIIGGVSTESKKAYRTVECFSTRSCKLIEGIASLEHPTSGLSAIIIDMPTNFNETDSAEFRGC